MEAVRKWAKGLSPRAKTTRADELSQVAVGINEMASGLSARAHSRRFRAFVSPQVATEFIETYAKSGRSAELGGKRRDVVILFSDLRATFTPLSESLPPERLIEVLNGYFAEMVAAIHQQHGIVDKFIGDAVLAVFGLVDSDGSGRRKSRGFGGAGGADNAATASVV